MYTSMESNRIENESWDEQLKQLQKDNDLRLYFQTRNLKTFMSMYIKIDAIVCNDKVIDVPTIYDELRNLRNEITSRTKELSIIEGVSKKIDQMNNRNDNNLEMKLVNCLQNNPQINRIHDKLSSLQESFTNNSSKKGEMAENMLLKNLLLVFPDSDIQNTSHLKDACDIQIKRENFPDILIDSKHFESGNVPKRDLDKFQQNCSVNNSSGILCNAFGGIANKQHFEIDIIDTRIYVYICNHQFDSSLFQLAVKIIYNIHNIVKGRKTNVIELDQQLYQRLKIEYNFFLQSFQQHLDIIKTNINSMSQLCFTQLDHFFKRSNFNLDAKPFSCHLCGTGMSTDKALKRHLRDKHELNLTKTKKPSEQED